MAPKIPYFRPHSPRVLLQLFSFVIITVGQDVVGRDVVVGVPVLMVVVVVALVVTVLVPVGLVLQ